jgi:hypothetical protein
MTNTVFTTFQTQYILDFSSASRSGTLGFAKHEIFTSKDVASVLKYRVTFWANSSLIFHIALNSGYTRHLSGTAKLQRYILDSSSEQTPGLF